jgi:1-acyl-sn-glycerol-3-phosphate acyltransferase
MTFDGFLPSHKAPFVAYSPEVARHVYGGIERLSARRGVRVEGLEHLPEGRAIIVANHSFGFDVAFPVAAISRALGRRVWVLGEHLWWSVPFVRRLVSSIGVVDGTPDNLDRVLQADELVLVLPGGLREAVKPRELRYQLMWGHRYGFVRAAIRNRAPIVPLASVGADSLFDFVGNPFDRGARWLGRRDLPVPLPLTVLPIPRAIRLSYAFGEPIVPIVPPEQESDMKALRRMRHEVSGALHELIEDELTRRAGMAPSR